jgi:hypothetical protein
MANDTDLARRQYLMGEWANLNGKIDACRRQMTGYSGQKASIVRELRDLGLSVQEIAAGLGLTRQAIYNVLGQERVEDLLAAKDDLEDELGNLGSPNT